MDAHARAKNAEHDERKKGVVANAAVAVAAVEYCYFHDDTHHHHLERRWKRLHRPGNEWYHMEGQIYQAVVASQVVTVVGIPLGARERLGQRSQRGPGTDAVTALSGVIAS